MNVPALLLTALTGLSANAADLRIEVTFTADRHGTVLAALFEKDKAQGFPKTGAVHRGHAIAQNGRATLDFSGLPEGDYAVSVFLDENGNGQLDSNLFGLPTELYGFSRNARGSMGPPAFADAALRVEGSLQNHAIELK